MSFFDNLPGFAGEVGGWAGQIAQSVAQVGNAVNSVRQNFGSGSGNGMPVWGAGTPFIPPQGVPPTPLTTTEKIGQSPILIVGLAGLAILLLAKK